MTSPSNIHSNIHSNTLIGIDVGGTFTDFVLLRDGRLVVHKIATTPDDQSRAILDGLRELGLDTNDSLDLDTLDIVHGMTVATNALLERRGARTALITTEGFADVLVIGRQNRPHLYKLHQSRPEPLVADAWRLEAPERIDYTGRILRALDEKAVYALVDKLARSDIESVAVALLFAFRRPDHERRIAALLRERLPNLTVSLSSDVLPEYREYERTATTVIHAYVQPLVASYLARLDDALSENFADSRVRIMQSHGGIIGLAQAASQAGRLVLSGPAGGVVGAFEVARQAVEQGSRGAGEQGSEEVGPRILTLDMGGTSTDVALCPGAIPTTAESTITDLPLRLPVIDIHTVGAGGGSIALVDAAGGLRVGPRSAGAMPGPICYGRGGTQPTVTDANLVLGRLDARGFLARGAGTDDNAAMMLDGAAAHSAFETLGASLNLPAQAAALGVIRVANATMERALRAVSVERGYDPADFVLVPFGGAGPLHACDLSDALGVEQILVPPAPGVLSAYGMLVADVAADASQSILSDAAALVEQPRPLRNAFATLREQTTRLLHDEGLADPTVTASLDLRYRGQSYELSVPLSTNGSELNAASVADAIAGFHDAHDQRYGYAAPHEAVEAVTLRVRAQTPGARPLLPRQPLGDGDPSAARLDDATVWFSADDGEAQSLASACYARERLRPGNRFNGPALVLQYDTTLVVAPGWSALVDGMGNLRLETVG